jgi:glycosyltransferase involved in cell wall biosynthesis
LSASGGIQLSMTHSEPGGLREIWNDLAAGLIARGHMVDRFVLYPNRGADQRDHAAAEGWLHLLPERPSGMLATPRLFAALVRHLRRTRPAAVVTAMPFCDVIMPLAVRAAGTPTKVYVSHHSPITTHNRVLARLDGLTARMDCVAAVISVSHAVAASLDGMPAAYRAKRVTITNALPDKVEQLIDRLRDSGTVQDVPGRIVALGRLTHQKNYPMLIRALARMPAGSLDILGIGEDEQDLRALAAEQGVAERIRFLGQVSREEALAHAATAQVFVQVSHFEGHSLALIEAARLGLPLVVSQVPVQVEGITAADGETCGIAVPIGDEAALAAVLTRLLADPRERAAWAGRARRLGVEASNRAMVDAYERLLVPARARC